MMEILQIEVLDFIFMKVAQLSYTHKDDNTPQDEEII